jgi:hypothetical protein
MRPGQTLDRRKLRVHFLLLSYVVEVTDPDGQNNNDRFRLALGADEFYGRPVDWLDRVCHVGSCSGLLHLL